jgi:uncharacterized protein YdiU (UPF0061 family)
MQICLKAIASWPTEVREVILSEHLRRVQIPRPAAAFSRTISSIRIWRRNVRRSAKCGLMIQMTSGAQSQGGTEFLINNTPLKPL